jgi:hypothetical protein
VVENSKFYLCPLQHKWIIFKQALRHLFQAIATSPDTRFDTNFGAWLSHKSKPEARKLATWKAKLSATVAIWITDRDQETNS